MDKDKLEFFKQCLLAERATVLAELEQLDQDSRENAEDQTEEGAWDADVASDVSEKERIMSERKHLVEHLAEIERALARIEQGSYGFSVISGKPIPIERLEILPWATRCVDEESLVRR